MVEPNTSGQNPGRWWSWWWWQMTCKLKGNKMEKEKRRRLRHLHFFLLFFLDNYESTFIHIVLFFTLVPPPPSPAFNTWQKSTLRLYYMNRSRMVFTFGKRNRRVLLTWTSGVPAMQLCYCFVAFENIPAPAQSKLPKQQLPMVSTAHMHAEIFDLLRRS